MRALPLRLRVPRLGLGVPGRARGAAEQASALPSPAPQPPLGIAYAKARRAARAAALAEAAERRSVTDVATSQRAVAGLPAVTRGAREHGKKALQEGKAGNKI
jgi:hypothetical protein